MNIDKYINWGEIWGNEISVESSIDDLIDDIQNTKIVGILEQFKTDKEVELHNSECRKDDNVLIFCFSETGGQNESDTQGWCRDYTFVVDENFSIIDADYQQG